MVGRITRDELKAKLDRREPVTLLEALPPRYFLDRHLPGAVNLPPNKVKELAPTVLPEKTADIVVYCGGAT